MIKNKTPYWWEAINKAENRGQFNCGEVSRANHWSTCACGKQSKLIPRYSRASAILYVNIGAPKDEYLKSLGKEFYFAIGKNQFSRARKVLSKIERRSAKLLQGLKKGKNGFKKG